jgi:hypothetical protein
MIHYSFLDELKNMLLFAEAIAMTLIYTGTIILIPIAIFCKKKEE